MGRLEIGDLLDPNEVNEEYELYDWGEIINGQYSYKMLDHSADIPEEYTIVVDQYRVVKKENIDT